MQVIAAVVVFIIAYGLIISGKIHYALAALGGALLLVLLGIITQVQALASVDFNTLGLLLGMMLVLGIIGRTGLFQYLAAWSVRLARGEPFLILLLTVLMIITYVPALTMWLPQAVYGN